MSNDMRIGIAVSYFNKSITTKLAEGARERLKELEVADSSVKEVWVPGAFELPLMAQRMILADDFDAIICLGAVIRGETDHYDYVCQQVSYGCQKVALTHNIPVIFGVLTVDNREQALDRLGGNHGHKGRDAVDAAMTMIKQLKEIL